MFLKRMFVIHKWKISKHMQYHTTISTCSLHILLGYAVGHWLRSNCWTAGLTRQSVCKQPTGFIDVVICFRLPLPGPFLGIVFWSVASFILTNSIIGKIQTHDVNVLPRILDVQLSAPRALSMLQNNGPWDSWRSQLHRQCGSIMMMLLILLFDHLVCANNVCIMYHSSRPVFAWSNPQIYFSQIGNCMHFGETSWCHCKTCCGWGLESIFLQTQKLKNCNAAEAVVINLHRHRVARATRTAHEALKQMTDKGGKNWPRTWPALLDLPARTGHIDDDRGTLTMTVAQRLWLDFLFCSKQHRPSFLDSNMTPGLRFRRFGSGSGKVAAQKNVRDCI